jgi:hypothetical protein
MSKFVKVYAESVSERRDHKQWAFWSYCLLKAAWADGIVKFGKHEVAVKRGELVFGRKKAAEDLCMSEHQVRLCLEKAVATRKVAIKTASRFSVLTIVDYGRYNGAPEQNGQINGQQSGHIEEYNKKEAYICDVSGGVKKPAVASVASAHKPAKPSWSRKATKPLVPTSHVARVDACATCQHSFWGHSPHCMACEGQGVVSAATAIVNNS